MWYVVDSSLSRVTGADPGFQARGAHLEIFGVFRVKNHDFTPKNHGLNQRLQDCYIQNVCCFSALKNKSKLKTAWFGIRIMCPSGVIYLTTDCGASTIQFQFSLLVWYKTNTIINIMISSNVACFRHDIVENNNH